MPYSGVNGITSIF